MGFMRLQTHTHTLTSSVRFMGFVGICWDLWDLFGIHGITGFVRFVGIYGIYLGFMGFIGDLRDIWDLTGIYGIYSKGVRDFFSNLPYRSGMVARVMVLILFRFLGLVWIF